MFLNTVHFSLACALGHTSSRASTENLICSPVSPSWQALNAVFFFFLVGGGSPQHHETPEISAWSFSFFCLGFLQRSFGKCLEKKSSEDCSAYHFIIFHVFPDVAPDILSTLIACWYL